MAANHRTGEAVTQLLIAYGRLKQTGEADLANGVERKILVLDPDADLGAAVVAAAAGIGDGEMEFGEIDLGGGVEPEPFQDPGVGELRTAAEHFVADAQKGFEAAPEGEEDEEGEAEEAVPAGWGDEESDEGFELPMMSFDEEEDEPVSAAGEDQEGDEGEAVELPTFGLGEDAPEAEPAEVASAASSRFDGDPFRAVAPAESESSAAIEEAHEEVAAEAPAPARAAAPVSKDDEVKAPEGGYVDLGAMILGVGPSKKSTRFKVAYEEPTGDEEADFAKMLEQFKEKVSENIAAGDVRAHYDLGTAYKEMGLFEEAIGAFQAALRASAEHLPTYELMGQTFIEMGQPETAVRTLQRALKIQSGVEDEFVAIYYYLARAYEALDERESAVEFYDRVFSLDINFADVTERLRELR
jgi:hypothetical protein